MKIRSILYCDSLSEEEIQRHEHSDRVWIPRQMFERWLSEEDAGTIVTAQLDTVAVCIFGYHDGPVDTIYTPRWICERLGVYSTEHESEEDDYIVPIRFKPQMCTFLSLQPHTSHHLHVPMEPEECLATGMEQYTCIQKGQTLILRLLSGDIQEVTVVDLFPETEEPVCIRNPVGELELSLELLPPLDTPLSLPPIEVPPARQPAGQVLDPVTPVAVLSREEMREKRCRMFERKK